MGRKREAGIIGGMLVLGRGPIGDWMWSKSLDAVSDGVKSVKWSGFPWADFAWYSAMAGCFVFAFWPEIKNWWRNPSEKTLRWYAQSENDRRFLAIPDELDRRDEKIWKQIAILAGEKAALEARLAKLEKP